MVLPLDDILKVISRGGGAGARIAQGALKPTGLTGLGGAMAPRVGLPTLGTGVRMPVGRLAGKGLLAGYTPPQTSQHERREGPGGIFGAALTALDFGRGAVTSTIKESIDLLQGEGFSPSEWWNQATTQYGFGELIHDERNWVGGMLMASSPFTGGLGLALGAGVLADNIWADRVIGFIGDVAVDPLMYVGGFGAFARAAGWRGAGNQLGDYMGTLATKGLKASPQYKVAGEALAAGAQKKSLTATVKELTKTQVGREVAQHLGLRPGFRMRMPTTGMLGRQFPKVGGMGPRIMDLAGGVAGKPKWLLSKKVGMIPQQYRDMFQPGVLDDAVEAFMKGRNAGAAATRKFEQTMTRVDAEILSRVAGQAAKAPLEWAPKGLAGLTAAKGMARGGVGARFILETADLPIKGGRAVTTQKMRDRAAILFDPDEAVRAAFKSDDPVRIKWAHGENDARRFARGKAKFAERSIVLGHQKAQKTSAKAGVSDTSTRALERAIGKSAFEMRPFAVRGDDPLGRRVGEIVDVRTDSLWFKTLPKDLQELYRTDRDTFLAAARAVDAHLAGSNRTMVEAQGADIGRVVMEKERSPYGGHRGINPHFAPALFGDPAPVKVGKRGYKIKGRVTPGALEDPEYAVGGQVPLEKPELLPRVGEFEGYGPGKNKKGSPAYEADGPNMMREVDGKKVEVQVLYEAPGKPFRFTEPRKVGLAFDDQANRVTQEMFGMNMYEDRFSELAKSYVKRMENDLKMNAYWARMAEVLPVAGPEEARLVEDTAAAVARWDDFAAKRVALGTKKARYEDEMRDLHERGLTAAIHAENRETDIGRWSVLAAQTDEDIEFADQLIIEMRIQLSFMEERLGVLGLSSEELGLLQTTTARLERDIGKKARIKRLTQRDDIILEAEQVARHLEDLERTLDEVIELRRTWEATVRQEIGAADQRAARGLAGLEDDLRVAKETFTEQERLYDADVAAYRAYTTQQAQAARQLKESLEQVITGTPEAQRAGERAAKLELEAARTAVPDIEVDPVIVAARQTLKQSEQQLEAAKKHIEFLRERIAQVEAEPGFSDEGSRAYKAAERVLDDNPETALGKNGRPLKGRLVYQQAWELGRWNGAQDELADAMRTAEANAAKRVEGKPKPKAPTARPEDAAARRRRADLKELDNEIVKAEGEQTRLEGLKDTTPLEQQGRLNKRLSDLTNGTGAYPQVKWAEQKGGKTVVHRGLRLMKNRRTQLRTEETQANRAHERVMAMRRAEVREAETPPWSAADRKKVVAKQSKALKARQAYEDAGGTLRRPPDLGDPEGTVTLGEWAGGRPVPQGSAAHRAAKEAIENARRVKELAKQRSELRVRIEGMSRVGEPVKAIGSRPAGFIAPGKLTAAKEGVTAAEAALAAARAQALSTGGPVTIVGATDPRVVNPQLYAHDATGRMGIIRIARGRDELGAKYGLLRARRVNAARNEWEFTNLDTDLVRARPETLQKFVREMRPGTAGRAKKRSEGWRFFDEDVVGEGSTRITGQAAEARGAAVAAERVVSEGEEGVAGAVRQLGRERPDWRTGDPSMRYATDMDLETLARGPQPGPPPARLSGGMGTFEGPPPPGQVAPATSAPVVGVPSARIDEALSEALYPGVPVPPARGYPDVLMNGRQRMTEAFDEGVTNLRAQIEYVKEQVKLLAASSQKFADEDETVQVMQTIVDKLSRGAGGAEAVTASGRVNRWLKLIDEFKAVDRVLRHEQSVGVPQLREVEARLSTYNAEVAELAERVGIQTQMEDIVNRVTGEAIPGLQKRVPRVSAEELGDLRAELKFVEDMQAERGAMVDRVAKLEERIGLAEGKVSNYDRQQMDRLAEIGRLEAGKYADVLEDEIALFRERIPAARAVADVQDRIEASLARLEETRVRAGLPDEPFIVSATQKDVPAALKGEQELAAMMRQMVEGTEAYKGFTGRATVSPGPRPGAGYDADSSADAIFLLKQKTRNDAQKYLKEALSKNEWGPWTLSKGGEYNDEVRAVAEAFSKVNNPTKWDGAEGLWKKWDTFQTYLKAAMIATPGFVNRNIFGAFFNAWLDDVNPNEIIRSWNMTRQVAERSRREGTDFYTTAKQMAQTDDRFKQYVELLEVGVRGGGQAISSVELEYGLRNARNLEMLIGRKDGMARLGTGRNSPWSMTWAPWSPRFFPYQSIRAVNSWVEDIVRLGVGMDTMRWGGNVDDAIARIAKTQFDYDELTDFERTWMRRFFPFYTWTRKNVPYQLNQLARHPAKYNKLLAAKRNLELGTEDEDIVPDYFLEPFGVRLPFSYKGATVYSAPDFPFQDLARYDPFRKGPKQAIQNVASMLTPILKAPLETGMGKQIYSGVPFTGRYQLAPGAISKFPGMKQALQGIGWIKQSPDGAWKMRDHHIYIVTNMIPSLGVLRRLAPNEPKYQRSLLRSIMSTMGGVSASFNTDMAKHNWLTNLRYERQEQRQNWKDRTSQTR